MSEERFKVVFQGALIDGADPEEVGQNLSRLFSVSAEKAAKILSSREVIIKSGLDKKRALQYRQVLAKAGIRINLVRLAPDVPDLPLVASGSVIQDPVSKPAAVQLPEVSTEDLQQALQVRFEFTGSQGEYLKLWLTNLLFSVLTLGFYSAWAKVRCRQYFFDHTRLEGQRFVYRGRPFPILLGRLIGLLSIAGCAAAGYLMPPRGYAFSMMLVILVPWLWVHSLKYHARQSSYSGLSFDFHGTTRGAIGVLVIWPLVAVLSAGVLLPLAYHRFQQFLSTNYSYGDARFEFTAEPSDYYGVFAVTVFGVLIASAPANVLYFASQPAGLVLSVLIFVLAFAYLSVQGINRRFDHILIGEQGFSAELGYRDYWRLYLSHSLALILTVGLFWPIARIRLATYKADHLTLIVHDSLAEFIRTATPQKRVREKGSRTDIAL